MDVWRVNINSKTYYIEESPSSWEQMGGRGLLAQILLDEVDPACDPLGPENKLIFSPGLLTGYRLSSLDRISIGAKSPLTGGIKEANAGGKTANHLALLGIKALILEDQPSDETWTVIHISKTGIRFDDASDFVGLGVYQCGSDLIKKYGEDVAIAIIGLGGERRNLAAGIQNNDKDNVPSRIAARGGLGAVMGSKLIKAIVIDASDGVVPDIHDVVEFKKARKKYTVALMGHPQTKTYSDYGTAAMVNLCNEIGAMPTRGFSAGSFEDAEEISGEKLRELILARGGVSDPSHACMTGCAIKCSNVLSDESGEKVLVSPIDYETIGLMGSNLGINNLDMIAKLNYEVNDLGLDSIEIGAALGVAAEAGLMEFGDGEGALSLINEIHRNTELGNVIADGTVSVGKKYGIERIPVAKGQAMPAYDPRAIKGTGVTFATSPQGADHTCGLTIRAKVKHTDPKGQVEVSRNAQFSMAGYDTLGACIMSGFGFAVKLGVIGELINTIYGWEVGEDYLQQLGKKTLLLEREFNRLAGFTKEDDRLPEWMTREALPPQNTVFDVTPEDLDSVFDF